jgi:hypothetical protein
MALRVGQLHNHLVREHPSDNFRKFSSAEVLHFHKLCKLGQQRKIANENESLRPTKYSKRRESTLSFDSSHKKVHNIDSDGCGPPKNWEKNYRPPRQESENGIVRRSP